MLAALAVMGCDGGDAAERPLVDLLPKRLAGVRLERQGFAGPKWMHARAESSSAYSPPQFRPDLRAWLRMLHGQPRNLTVAWALAPEGIQVIAYRVRGAHKLLPRYVSSLPHGTGHRTIEVAGKRVLLLSDSLPQRAFAYTYGDVVYTANSLHVDGNELEELIAKLPGRGGPPPSLEQRLPAELAGVRLERRLFTGPRWIAAAPEQAFQPEVKVRLRKFLVAVDAPASALTTAWALGPDGPKVVAYRVTGVSGRRLLRAFVQAVGPVHELPAEVSGKRVVVVVDGILNRRGYLYANEEVLFVAGSNHLTQQELRQLFALLP